MDMYSLGSIYITTPRLILRNLRPEDVTQDYADWLNDPEVNRFLSCAGIRQTLESCREYVRSYEGLNDKALIGIFTREGCHIGNITISSVDRKRREATIGICVGRKKCWSQGFGTEAVSTLVQYGFQSMGLRHFTAGVNVRNTASVMLFERCCFYIKETMVRRNDGQDKVHIFTINGNRKPVFVFESTGWWARLCMTWCRIFNIPVGILEPFYAYHHNKEKMRFSPQPLPVGILNLIQKGKIQLLKAGVLDIKGLYRQAADKAVMTFGQVYPVYKSRSSELIEYTKATLSSRDAENVFRISLSEQLAEFYSTNMLLQKIGEVLGATRQVVVFPVMNVREYRRMKKVLFDARVGFFEHYHIRFSIIASVQSYFCDMRKDIICFGKLFCQAVVSIFGFRVERIKREGEEKAFFKYGISIVSPRQLMENQRRADFLIDRDKIQPGEVVYFSLAPLGREQLEQHGKVLGKIVNLSEPGKLFSNGKAWIGLLWIAIHGNFVGDHRELNATCSAFFNYFSWKDILRHIGIQYYVTHCDFGIRQVGRNIALRQEGVQTWYFMDSINQGDNFVKNGCPGRHPFWCFLDYDHLVAWNRAKADYFLSHPGSFRQVHVVGCLWAGHLNNGKNPAKERKGFVIAAFDSTYTKNEFTSYAEGIQFAEHLFKLADEFEDVYIILKEKKARKIHKDLDNVLGPGLAVVYERMEQHPRIEFRSDKTDSSELMAQANLVISFPFTSTTFEALSADYPALWHDPLELYRETAYGKLKGVTTHGYDELRSRVLQIKTMREPFRNPVPEGSPLLDPFRDGKAIDRFRSLLSSGGQSCL